MDFYGVFLGGGRICSVHVSYNKCLLFSDNVESHEINSILL